jgi:hypothetical protein
MGGPRKVGGLTTVVDTELGMILDGGYDGPLF